MRTALLVLPLALFACKPSAEKEKDKGTTAETTGADTKGADTKLGPFTAVQGNGPADLDVTVGPAQAIATACTDGPTSRVKMSVEDGKLVVVSPSESKCKVTLSTPTLTGLEAMSSGNVVVHGKAALATVDVRGSGDIDVENVETDHLALKVGSSGDLRVKAMKANATKLDMLGSGDVQLAGTTTTLEAKVVGSSTVQAKTLVAETVKLDVTGSGSVAVDATKKADVTVTGSGSVKIAGNPPERTKKLVGSGSLSFE